MMERGEGRSRGQDRWGRVIGIIRGKRRGDEETSGAPEPRAEQR